MSFALHAEAEVSLTKSLEDDAVKIAQYQAKCEANETLVVDKAYEVGCFTNYNHYFPSKKIIKNSQSIRIANYNLLHPGTSKALFKDYGMVAKIINQYDIVSALELLAVVGRDEQNNRAVLEFIIDAPNVQAKLKAERLKLKDATKIQEIEIKIAKHYNDTRAAYDLYRAPGYLKILKELKKLDPSWALLLSPRGDSALVGSVEELTGYFYRGSTATPTINPHCKEYAEEGAGTPYACFINLTQSFMGRDLVQHFARRPFMASFKVNTTKFTLVTSHVVFTYSGDEDATKDLLKKTFSVESLDELGPGINLSNFARFAEVKNTLEFMERYKSKYKDPKIMFLSDMNLVSKNVFWPEVLKAFSGSELLITEASTLSPTRYLSTGKETNGIANDYDHFVLDKKSFPGCDNGEVYNYFQKGIIKEIEQKYVIRQEIVGLRNKSFNFGPEAPIESEILEGDVPPVDDPATVKLEYPLTPKGQSKMDKFVMNFDKYLNSLQTIKNNQIVPDSFQVTERLDGLRRRVFLRQLTNPFYHRFMQEVLSDHFPVALTCRF